MKNVAYTIAIIATLQGCGNQENRRNPVDQHIAEIGAKLRSMGFNEPNEVKELIQILRVAAVNGDRQVLVNAIHYPFNHPAA